MKKAKKLLALLLVAVMCFGLSATALAAGEFSYEEVDAKAVDYKILHFGDSTSNGYGLNDYIFNQAPNGTQGALQQTSKECYAYLFGQYVQKALGPGFDVSSTSLCFQGMRTDELRSILDAEYQGDGFCVEHINSYQTFMNYYGYGDLREYTANAIKEADCIVVDTTMNNFGTYLSQRLMVLMGMQEDHHGYLNDTVAKLVDKEIPGTRVAVETLIEGFIDAYGLREILETAISGGTVQDFIDMFVYCYVDFCINFNANIEHIRELNPTAKIIVCGAYNGMSGLTATLEGLNIDFGGFWASFMGLVNNYITLICPNSSQYVYADMSGEIELFIDNLAAANSPAEIYESFADRLYDDTMDMIRKATGMTMAQIAEAQATYAYLNQPSELNPEKTNYEMAQYVVATAAENCIHAPGLTNLEYAIEYKDTLNTLAEMGNEKAQLLIMVRDNYPTAKQAVDNYASLQLAGGLTRDNILNCYIEAARCKTLDLALTFGLLGSGDYGTSVAKAFSAGTLEGSDPGTTEVVHILARFLNAMGLGTHPDDVGSKQKLDRVVEAWYKIKPASQEAGDTVADFWHNLGSSILKTFQNPLLEKINELFNSFIESFFAFWQNILGLGK